MENYYLIIWLGIAIVTGIAADSRGRSGFGWFILGCILSILALLAVLVMPSLKRDSNTPTPETHIRCPDCKELVLKEALVCKHCGCKLIPQSVVKVKKPTSPLVILLAVVLGFAFLANFKDFGINGTSNPSGVAAPQVAQTNVVQNSQWSYSQVADAMSKGTTYHAAVSSTNTVDFKFPYAGAQHARLSLRIDPRNGKDVIFRIEKGQILCHSYEDCTVLVRFDDEQATNYSAVGAADNSTETIFIRNYDRFIGKMLDAKQVRISTNIYQQGAPVFEFDVSGFDLNKYKPKK